MGFPHRAMPNAPMKPFPGTFEDPFADMMTQFEPMPPENHPPETSSIDHNNKLLSFSMPVYSFTLLDYSLRRTSLSLSAQLHGMFFLAESPWTTSPGDTAPPPMAELTCYRRNLFQITGSVTLPRSLRYIMTEQGDRIPVIAQELTVSATESVEGNSVKIISVPWKTSAANPAPAEDKVEKEPPPIPLDTMAGQELDSDYATFPIAWKRLQFRIATANNGRRKELQQHFVVKLKVVATLSTGAKISVCEAHSGPVIVRGRSPRNFQSRKDLPLSGSAASSRKNAQQAHAAASRSAAANDSAAANKEKAQVEVPPPAFQFDSSTSPQQQQVSPTFADWGQMTQPHSATTMPTSFANAGMNGPSSAIYPQSTPDASRQNNNNSGNSNNTPRRRTGPTAPPISLSLVDDDPKPSSKPADSSKTKPRPNNNNTTHPSTTAPATLPSSTTAPAVSIHRDSDQPPAKARKMSQTSSNKNFSRRQRSLSSTLTIPAKQQPPPLQTQSSPHFSGLSAASAFISPNESADLLYEYFPLGLDDWQAPVDAVYRPHVVHHMNLPVDPKAIAAKSRGKRYFADTT